MCVSLVASSSKANPRHCVHVSMQASSANMEAEQALRLSAEQKAADLQANLDEMRAALQASEVRVVTLTALPD